MGECVKNQFALDLCNRVPNEPRSNLIRQLIDCDDESMFGHSGLLKAMLRLRSGWLGKNDNPFPNKTLGQYG
jgi:hypothetical protein